MGEIKELSLGCRVTERQIVRGMEYKVQINYVGIGALDTNSTVKLDALAQEILAFDVTPKTLMIDDLTKIVNGQEFNLTLKNHNLFTDQLPASGKTP